MKKVCCVIGTRPDALKMLPVINQLSFRKTDFSDVRAISTGQHSEMLQQVMKVFQIVPDRNLDIMAPNQTLSDLSARLLPEMEAALRDFKPDWVIAQGDTTTTFIAALAAYYAKMPFAHVEAGLRTHNKYDPYPEEMNRVLTARLSDFHFAPTPLAAENLVREGITENVHVTGNTGIDVLLYVKRQFDEGKNNSVVADELTKEPGKYLLVTLHRRESFGEPHRHICRAIKRFVSGIRDARVIATVHPNPSVQDVLQTELGGTERIALLSPQLYADFVALMSRSYAILTDSGGIQEEAPSLGVPVLVARETTERPEGIEAGCAKLVGTSAEGVYSALMELFMYQSLHDKMAQVANPYGDGKAAERICDILSAA